MQQSKLTCIAAGWRADTSNMYFQNLEKALKGIKIREGEESILVFAKNVRRRKRESLA